MPVEHSPVLLKSSSADQSEARGTARESKVTDKAKTSKRRGNSDDKATKCDSVKADGGSRPESGVGVCGTKEVIGDKSELMASISQHTCRLTSTLLRTRLAPGLLSTVPSRLASSLTSVNDADGVRHVTMTSPKTRNALSLEMLNELQEHVTQLSPDIRCVVLSGQGPAFSAGHNLKELTSKDGRAHHQCVFDTCSELMLGLQRLDVPVIAQVDGTAAAAGFQLVASCDIVIATPRSSFSTPGGNVGIFCSTPGIAVSRALPRRLAAHLLLTGLPLSGEEALRAGLISRLVEPDQLQRETAHIAAAIVSKSRSVITLGKKFFYKQLELPIEEAYKLGSRVMVDNIALKDGQEGICGFIEKRKPTWTHSEEKAHD